MNNRIYSIGKEIAGATLLDYSQTRYDTVSEADTVVVMADKESDAKLIDYYKAVASLIRVARVIFVATEGEFRVKSYITQLMAAREHYDIYEVEDLEEVDSAFINRAKSRKPTLEETKLFVDKTALSAEGLAELLVGIKSAVEENNADSLISLISEKRNDIDSAVFAIEQLKGMAENSIQIQTGTEEIEDLKDIISDLEKSVSDYKNEIAKHIEKEKELNSKISLLQDSAAEKPNETHDQKANSNIIKMYSEVNTAIVPCNAKAILYFKEISYVQYTKSLINHIFNYMSAKHNLAVKLIVYDNQTSFSGVYAPLPVVATAEYLKNKDNIVNKQPKVVVTEPNRVIIEDILKSNYDVIMIYDRMGQAHDVVVGNNVYKFWVVNSSNDFAALSKIGIKADKSSVITASPFLEDAISVPELSTYRNMTESAKAAKYYAMQRANKKPLIPYIVARSNIDKIQPRGR